jgi:hypothetical protein
LNNEKICIKVQVKTSDIAFLVQIMEGHDYIGVVSTTDPKDGQVMLQVTPNTYDAAKEILENLPIELKFV